MKTKYTIIFFLSVIVMYLIFIVWNKIEYKDFNKKQKYVLGVVTNFEGGKNGVYYDYYFKYKEKIYTSTFSKVGKSLGKNDLIFIQIQEDNPDLQKVLFDIKVSDCFKFNQVPVEGWSQIPKDSCK